MAQLEKASSRMSVGYAETPSGAAITLATADRSLVEAIHQWLAAQQRDHDMRAMNHCAMR